MTKILLVDDSKIQRNWAKKGLADNDYEFIEGCNGLEALDLMKEHQPNLIICDMNMPTMGGLECMETMQARGLDFPVIVLTADIQDSTREKCMKLGAKGFVTKPIKDDSLLIVVKEILKELQS